MSLLIILELISSIYNNNLIIYWFVIIVMTITTACSPPATGCSNIMYSNYDDTHMTKHVPEHSIKYIHLHETITCLKHSKQLVNK